MTKKCTFTQPTMCNIVTHREEARVKQLLALIVVKTLNSLINLHNVTKWCNISCLFEEKVLNCLKIESYDTKRS